ncbi:unnamed protein product [Paramecium octaurelia]|uniref:Transmembrane protein n=1 Tax=Paramecium octaurelia TaxID=43137 RepID=A0A8S1U3F9_PAROT|nr:unnamed protein product [Paramecium octaurelia]
MNNFTLTFHSKQLEENYQINRLWARKVIYLGIITIVLINNVLKIIIDSVDENNTSWPIELVIVILCVIGLILFTKLKPYLHVCLILINYICAIEYFQLDSSYSIHQAYAKGCNIMVVQMIILFGTEFKHCLHQIIFISTIRILFSFVLGNEYMAQQYFLSFSLIIAQIMTYYFLHLALRKQYLLKLKEDQQQQFIPIVIKQPFYYFEYKSFQFHLIKTNAHQQQLSQADLLLDYCQGCRLRQMLRNYKLQGQTLESFIIDRMRQRNAQQYSEQELEIQTNFKNNQIISYSELFSDKTQFLIVFKSNVTELSQYLQIKEYYNKFQQFITNHISNTYKILKLPKQKIIRNLIRLNLSCTSTFTFQSSTIKSFDALKVLKVLKTIVHHDVKIISSEVELVVHTYKILFIIAFYHIFEIFNQMDVNVHKLLKLTSLSNQDYTYLQISISFSELNNFIQRWNDNKILKKLEINFFYEIIPNEIFIITIRDLGLSVPYQKPYQRKKHPYYQNFDDETHQLKY